MLGAELARCLAPIIARRRAGCKHGWVVRAWPSWPCSETAVMAVISASPGPLSSGAAARAVRNWPRSAVGRMVGRTGLQHCLPSSIVLASLPVFSNMEMITNKSRENRARRIAERRG